MGRRQFGNSYTQKPYDRCERVGTELRAVIAQHCLMLDDPRTTGLQITNVKVSRDLRLARIYYFLRGDANTREACQAGLEEVKGSLKQAISSAISLKYMPDLKFHFDESIEHSERISDILEELDLPPEEGDEDYADV